MTVQNKDPRGWRPYLLKHEVKRLAEIEAQLNEAKELCRSLSKAKFQIVARGVDRRRRQDRRTTHD